MSNYDAYLEKPYQDRYAEEADREEFAEWCEDNDLDPEYEDFDQWVADREDDYYSDRAESMAEDAYFDRD